MKTITPSDHAGADLRVESPRTSGDFIVAMNKLKAPLPWGCNEDGDVYDADGETVCTLASTLPDAAGVAEMIVTAVNTCGSFRATRRV